MHREYVKKIVEKNSRILEFGPLNYPIFKKEDYPNVKYADIRSTEDVKKLYSGNLYLKKTGIHIDPNSIVEIDYVIDKKYKDFFKQKEKFDVIVLAHVIEHMIDIIDFFEDIQTILKPDGKLIILYPDKRYCFDYYRNSISFREAYYIHKNKDYNQYLIADFLSNVIPHNNPNEFWKKDKMIEQFKEKNKEKFLSCLDGVSSDDVHYFPFDPISFYKFLIDMTNEEILKLKIEDLKLTIPNTQEFLIILKNEKFNKEEIIKKYYKNYHNLILQDNELIQRILFEVESSLPIKEIIKQYEMLKVKMEEQEKAYAELQETCNKRCEKLKQYYENSTSMKITKPLRSIKKIVNKMVKK